MQKIEQYRKVNGLEDSIFVIVSPHNVISGWMSVLGNNNYFIPGSCAYNINGDKWIATGGNDFKGSERWEKLP